MIYATSDLHGYPIDRFKALLDKADFSDDDYCFVLGDVIDRGPESVDLLKWLMMQKNIKFIMGNHEAMLLDCSFLFDTITDKALDHLNKDDMDAFNTWIINGGRETLRQLYGCGRETILQIFDYLRAAPLYASVCVNNRDFLLVHSGLGEYSPEKKIEDYSHDELIWTRPKLKQSYFNDITTILGHTPTYFYGQEYRGKALVTNTWIDIDTGAAYGGSPMLLRLDDMKEFYAD